MKKIIKYTDEEYDGKKIQFAKGKGTLVFARCPSISSQYIGSGRTKEDAFNDAKNLIDKLNSVNKKITESKSMLCKYDDLPKDDSIEYRWKGKILRIYADENPQSPREWDNMGTMACSHKRYSLGDEQIKSDNFDGWEEVRNHLIKDKGAVVILPLYLYDHSGITMSTKSFNDRWDSGQVGFIYVTKEDLKKEGVSKEKAIKILEQEVKTYDNYLTGEVYGYRVYECKNGNWVETDAVWGFYGDMKENGILQDVVGDWKKVQ